ncbi:RNA-induced silencing complex, nuclease component Tudor-SN [Artemisia annua]|uniref:RNA-induced silencing complex, nuclease component Tudor-SN n=1 Tax=Artemisia annua TaxID=35608 RepID=A0A2U1M3U5_ARTAN|nr:RNA-induced silencing complex, nuclease component Tudor-SN [Artemisia annua]
MGICKICRVECKYDGRRSQRKLKAAKLHAKKTKLRLWTNYVTPATNSKAISDSFTRKESEDVNSTTAIPPAAATQYPGLNVITRGFGTIIRHRDFEERSNHYENLLAAETRVGTL